MPHGDLLVELRGITKDYHGLRPLRLRSLELRQGQSLALLGFDRAMAEVLVNLITGAHLPDTGEVRVFGRATSAIEDASDWMRALDQFGLVSERAVLLEELTAEQNVAMPISLEIIEMPAALRAHVRRLGDEVSLTPHELSASTGALPPAARLRIRLARALALDPKVLLAEHPNALIPPEDAPALAADFARVVERRGLGALVLTADRTFAGAVADEVLTLEPATGALKAALGRNVAKTFRKTGWRRWFP